MQHIFHSWDCPQTCLGLMRTLLEILLGKPTQEDCLDNINLKVREKIWSLLLSKGRTWNLSLSRWSPLLPTLINLIGTQNSSKLLIPLQRVSPYGRWGAHTRIFFDIDQSQIEHFVYFLSPTYCSFFDFQHLLATSTPRKLGAEWH